MPNDEENLLPSQPAEELELENPQGSSGGDPLDEIQDIKALQYIATTLPAFNDEHKVRLDEITDRDELLGEVKKIRGIGNRIQRKQVPKVETPVQIPDSGKFLTKQDFYKSNEKKAIREATADAEVKANWNEIIPFYTPRRGKETPEDIREDIQDAITLFKARHAEVQKDDSKDQLTTTPVVKSGGGEASKGTKKTPEPPNFKLPTQPKDWYKK